MSLDQFHHASADMLGRVVGWMFDGLEWTLAFTWPLVLLGMVIWVVRKARSAL